ncbi:ABC transporter related protein [Desulfarculus baarsii DSM 2075]|uniref:ABC transporter related protein n=1 Tax=Desulfarculus baarsii (strain ATCC 33931 / DSM 2075 / LMG 7858 / VKM B-1802 / 2st14) TaxID=644282 RepID=E1QHL0_DESB2|nr:ATP-binding cassette domain-containing protein [Desulfarculus baarsii]ADK85053.1 ABC transporter related protein [Desulfarculus baarsii DSM 2075]
MSQVPRRGRLTGVAWSALGLVLLLALWQAAATHYSSLAIASPWDTLTALGQMLSQGDFWADHLLVSLGRVTVGLGLGLAAGLSLGVLAGALPPLRRVLSPTRWMLMSVPGVVVIMLAMLWFGMGGAMVVAIVATMVAPLIYISVVEGLDAVDARQLEMARVYHFPLAMRLYRIHGMAMAGPLIAGGLMALGSAIRLVVLAEALGAAEGLGYALALARTNLETPRLYALALLCVCVVAGVELAVLRPVRRRVLRRGQRPPASLDDAAGDQPAPGNGPHDDADRPWVQIPPCATPNRQALDQAQPLVALEGVCLAYQGRTVLDGVDLTVKPGEALGVLGPSGAGKSTLLRLIAGLERPDAGHLTTRVRRLGYAFQEPRLLPWCTAQENVALPLRALGLERRQALAMARRHLELMELTGRENAFPAELSGGMRQRVSLARALAVGADLMLLDEPFTGLDPRLRDEMLRLLESGLRESQAAAIMVTHDQADLPACTGRVVVLDGPGPLKNLAPPARFTRRLAGQGGL